MAENNGASFVIGSDDFAVAAACSQNVTNLHRDRCFHISFAAARNTLSRQQRMSQNECFLKLFILVAILASVVIGQSIQIELANQFFLRNSNAASSI